MTAVTIYDLHKKEIESLDVKLDEYCVKFDKAFIHNCLYKLKLIAHAKRTVGTKTIANVSGTTKKPWRQKGTGNARQGSLRSPQFRGGAVIFGPLPKVRNVSIQKTEIDLARKMILSFILRAKKFHVVNNITLPDCKTKNTLQILENFAIDTISKFVVIHNNEFTNENLLSSRNLKNVRYFNADSIPVTTLAAARSVLFTKSAFNKLFASVC